jgi:hypothetical protein
MPTKRNKAGKLVKSVTDVTAESGLRCSEMSRTRAGKAADREREESDLLWFANLLHGDPPEFPATQRPYQETAAEKAAFEQFVQQFPRRWFAALRDELDKAAKSKFGDMDPSEFYHEIVAHPERRYRNRSRTSTPIQLYRSIWETRQRLRDASRTMNFIAEQVGLRRQPLQICEGCGRLFILQRQDQLSCTERCSARRRVARARNLKTLREEVHKSRIARGAAAVARDFDYGSEDGLARSLRRDFSEAEVQRVLSDRARRKKPVAK